MGTLTFENSNGTIYPITSVLRDFIFFKGYYFESECNSFTGILTHYDLAVLHVGRCIAESATIDNWERFSKYDPHSYLFSDTFLLDKE